MHMKTAILKPEGGIRFQDMPIPKPQPGEALLRVLICGVCSSDIGAYRNGLGEDYILGHEVIAVIEEINGDPCGFSVGDRVTGMIFRGYRPYTTAKLTDLIAVPEGLDNAEAIVEPLACLQSGIERVVRKDCGPVAVVGAGYMGLALIRLLTIFGVKDITAVDMKESLFPLALEMGASRVCRPDQCEENSFEMTFETAGVVPTLELCGRMTRPLGTMVLVGYHPYPITLCIAEWQEKALTLVNSFESRSQYILKYGKEALSLVEQGLFPAKRLMTHDFPFDEVTQAMESQAKKPAGYLKSYIHIGDSQ